MSSGCNIRTGCNKNSLIDLEAKNGFHTLSFHNNCMIALIEASKGIDTLSFDNSWLSIFSGSSLENSSASTPRHLGSIHFHLMTEPYLSCPIALSTSPIH